MNDNLIDKIIKHTTHTYEYIFNTYQHIAANYINLGQLYALGTLIMCFSNVYIMCYYRYFQISQVFFINLHTLAICILMSQLYVLIDFKKISTTEDILMKIIYYMFFIGLFFYTMMLGITLFFSTLCTMISFFATIFYAIYSSMLHYNATTLSYALIGLLLQFVYLQLYRIQKTKKPYFIGLDAVPMYIDMSYAAILLISIISMNYQTMLIGSMLFIVGFIQYTRFNNHAFIATTRNICNPLLICAALLMLYQINKPREPYILHFTNNSMYVETKDMQMICTI